MNRTLKFRAWDRNEKLMHDVIVMQRDEFIAVPEIGTNGWELSKRKLSDVEVMQFTGLHDRIGTEIYEGDIVTYYDDGAPDAVPLTRVVTYDAPSFWLAKKVDVESFSTPEAIEQVIGNIYENPELLKV